MEDCINKKCMYYDKAESNPNSCLTETDITICPNHLIAKTKPLAEVPCSAGLSAEQLVDPGYYWWLPKCDLARKDQDEYWSIISWHPKLLDGRKGIFVGPLKRPSR